MRNSGDPAAEISEIKKIKRKVETDIHFMLMNGENYINRTKYKISAINT